MGLAEITPLVALTVSAATFIYTVWRNGKMDDRVKLVEEEQRKEREAGALRRSRAAAPYLTPSKKIAGHVFNAQPNGAVVMIHWSNGGLLHNRRREVEKGIPEDNPVVMVLDNIGIGAKRIKVAGEIFDVDLREEPDMPDAKGFVLLMYGFKSELLGKQQKVTMTFESDEGDLMTHVYRMRHGFFEFERIDPP